MSGLGSSALPPIDASLLPADVRNAGPERQEQYRAALAFERVMIGQLTEKVFKNQGTEDGDSAAVGLRRQQLPSALADAMIASGGLGLAAQLDASWRTGSQPVTTPLTTPGDGGAGA